MNEDEMFQQLTEEFQRESEEIEFDDLSEVDYDLDYTVQDQITWTSTTNRRQLNSTEDLIYSWNLY